MTTEATLHRVTATIPEIEITNQADRGRTRGVHGKTDATDFLACHFGFHQVGAQSPIQIGGLQCHLCQPGVSFILELIRIDQIKRTIGIGDVQRVGKWFFARGEGLFEQSVFIYTTHTGSEDFTTAKFPDFDCFGSG